MLPSLCSRTRGEKGEMNKSVMAHIKGDYGANCGEHKYYNACEFLLSDIIHGYFKKKKSQR